METVQRIKGTECAACGRKDYEENFAVNCYGIRVCHSPCNEVARKACNDFGFRAWDTENSKWLKEFAISSDGEVFLQGKDGMDDAYPSAILVQYTGIKDKSGKRVFEGDIVNWSSWKIGFKHLDGSEIKITPKVVVFRKGEFVLDYDATYSLGIYDNIEVVGNIYENSDLLIRK